ncbi:alpha-2-macroglobulin-like protein 1, partial [Clarias magur]
MAVPVVSVDTVASIKVQIKGIKTVLNKTTQILIAPPAELTIIETDKPIYKPGQTVMFRIVSLDTNFLTRNQMDPNSNRIGQWLNVTTNSGLVDLSYPVNSEAMEGFYLITARDEKNNPVTQTFEVKDYVLPKFEVTVTFPSVLTILDTYAVLKVCAEYTYGKPVNGTVTATICRNSYRNWFLPTGTTPLPNICRNYITEIKATDPKSNPIRSKVVHLTVTYSTNTKTVQTLVTNTNGTAEFSLNTDSWGSNTISLQAQYEATDTPVPVGTNQLTPHYPTPSLSLQPFYSKSQSFIKLNGSSVAFSCKQNGVIGAQYMIHSSALRPNQNTLSFFYMVMNKGQLVQRGQIVENLDHGTVHKGRLVVTLQKMQKLTPVAQVILYTVLPNGEAVADSRNFPIELCLANEVFNMLPFQTLSGYPYNINDEYLNTCGSSPLIKNIALMRLPPNPGKVDVYNMFK